MQKLLTLTPRFREGRGVAMFSAGRQLGLAFENELRIPFEYVVRSHFGSCVYGHGGAVDYVATTPITCATTTPKVGFVIHSNRLSEEGRELYSHIFGSVAEGFRGQYSWKNIHSISIIPNSADPDKVRLVMHNGTAIHQDMTEECSEHLISSFFNGFKSACPRLDKIVGAQGSTQIADYFNLDIDGDTVHIMIG